MVASPPLRCCRSILALLVCTLCLSDLRAAFLGSQLALVFQTRASQDNTSTALSSRGEFTRGLPLPRRTGPACACIFTWWEVLLVSDPAVRCDTPGWSSAPGTSTSECSHAPYPSPPYELISSSFGGLPPRNVYMMFLQSKRTTEQSVRE